MRTQETDVEVFGGEVESLTTAGIEGVGVRVIVDHRQGYASAGSLDPDVVDETLREARDNAEFGEPDEWNALATPADVDGVDRADARPVARRRYEPADRREGADRARARSRHQGARRARARRRSRGLRRRVGRVGDRQLARRRGDEPAHDRVRVRRSRSPTTAPAPRPATGSRPVASLADLDLESIPRRRGRPRRAGCSAPSRSPAAASRSCFDPLVTRSVLGVLSSAFNGESLLKGRVAVRRAAMARRSRRRSSSSSTTRRTRARSARRRYDSEGLPTRRNELIADGVLAGFLHNVYTGRRSGLAQHGQRSARRLRLGARCRRARARAAAGHANARSGHGVGAGGVLRAVGQRSALRARTRSAATSRSAPKA